MRKPSTASTNTTARADARRSMEYAAIAEMTRIPPQGEQERTRLQAVDLERREHARRRPRAGDPEAEQRHERAAGGRVVRGLGTRHALDDAGPEAASRVDDLLDRVRDEGRDRRPRSREDADEEPDEGSAQPRGDRPADLVGRHPDAALDGLALLLPLRAQGRRVPEHLADGEEPDRAEDDVDPVLELRDAERHAQLAGLVVGADHPEEQAEERREGGLWH